MYLNYNIQIITAEPAVRRQGTVARESFLLLSRDKIPNREEEDGGVRWWTITERESNLGESIRDDINTILLMQLQ